MSYIPNVPVEVVNPFPTGIMMPFAGANAPATWAFCFGQALSRVTEANLFSIIGVTYGAGDGINTFNVPNCSGRTIVGSGTILNVNASGVASQVVYPLGAIGGENAHKLTVDEMPIHKHGIKFEVVDYAGNYGVFQHNSNTNDSAWVDSPALQATGGDKFHNIMQPYIVCQYIIKL